MVVSVMSGHRSLIPQCTLDGQTWLKRPKKHFYSDRRGHKAGFQDLLFTATSIVLEEDDITILDNVFFALCSGFALGLDFSFAAQLLQISVFHHFSANELLFKISVNGSGSLRCLGMGLWCEFCKPTRFLREASRL